MEKCIDYALEHNINIKRQKVEAEKATNNHKQSKRNLLPSASAYASHSFNFGRSLNEDTYEYVNERFQVGNMSAQSEVALFNGRENINTIKMRKFEMLAQLERIEEARYDVTMNVVTYYLMVLSSIEQKNIREEQLAVTMDQIDQIREQIEVGKKAKGELLEIKAQAANEKAELTRARNDLVMAYVDLAQIMNLDSVETLQVKIPESLQVKEQSINNTEAVYSRALETFPSIQKAEYELEGIKKYLSVTKGRFYPELTLGARLQSYYNELVPSPYIKQLQDINVQGGVGVTLRIPLFNKFNQYTQVANARLDVKNSQLGLQEQKQNLYKNIQK
ncbi:MAG TPA: TolC family protein, partial [Bacteroidales bacterium]|nr:TolC family protein [Bacteroidales bacterium]